MSELRSILGPSALAGAILLLTLAGACGDRAGFGEEGGDFGNRDAIAPCGDRKCSRDLRSIVSACPEDADRVIETCPDDRGCGVGECVDPCDSARISKGSIGCSFWTLPPEDASFGQGSCFATIVANTWSRAITLRAELGAAPLDISRATYIATKTDRDTSYKALEGPLPPGQVAIIFLSHSPTPGKQTLCPQGVAPALLEDPIAHGTAKTRAFHIMTDAPASAYSIFPYGGAGSFYPTATLLLPVTSWDTSYLAVSTAMIGRWGDPGTEPRTLQIVASEDDTKVEMRPSVAIASGRDVEPALPGKAKAWTLSRGQVLQISQGQSVTGSPIVASKPIGVFGGASCARLPNEVMACDLTQQQIAPFSQWGSEYALVPFMPRLRGMSGGFTRELVPWSLVGAVDGTTLTYDPEKPRGAPDTLAAGQVVTFFTDALVVVKSQDAGHPFHAAVYMTGAKFAGGTLERPPVLGESVPATPGDPDFVNVVPSDQFLDRYVFFADYTYPETTLTVVRRRAPQGFLPVELECAGEITGWQPLGSKGEYEFAWLRITDGFVPQSFTKGACGYGRHEAKSAAPFSVTVWGLGEAASYGYAGGTGSRPVNNATPPPVQ